MKSRRHHNNDGRRQIKTGATHRFIQRLARSLGVPTQASPALKIPGQAEHGTAGKLDTGYAETCEGKVPSPPSLRDTSVAAGGVSEAEKEAISILASFYFLKVWSGW